MKTKAKSKSRPAITMGNREYTLEDKKCMTPKFRVSFPSVFEAKSFEDGPAKYSISMLFPKTTDLKEMKRAALNAVKEKWGDDKAKWPKTLRMPFRDGDEKEGNAEYEGCIFVGASSKARPQVIDQKKQPITSEDDTFYAGCYARATLIAFAYDTKGNKGVSFALQNLQKLADGERFGGKKSAVDEFDEVEDNSDNEESYDDEPEDSVEEDDDDMFA